MDLILVRIVTIVVYAFDCLSEKSVLVINFVNSSINHAFLWTICCELYLIGIQFD